MLPTERIAALANRVRLIPVSSHLVLTCGGFSADNLGGYRLRDALQRLTDATIIPVANPEFDIPNPVDVRTTKGKLALVRFGGSKILRKHYQPVALRIAATAYAYHQQHPELPVTLIGHSAGGIACRMAAQRLQGMGVRVQVVCIGSPWLRGVKVQGCVTLASKADPITRKGFVHGPVWTTARGHGIGDYLGCPVAQALLKTVFKVA